MKDNFSKQSEKYAQFRPGYPAGLYDFLKKNIASCRQAWDCGTGNGQVAQELSSFFDRVDATDISQKQLDNAFKKENIFYQISAAEKTPFPDHCFDLITVAQAIHWFDFDAFYSEVKRVLKPDGTIAVMGYEMIQTDTATDAVISELYGVIVKPYWDSERRYIEEKYQTIPFPFHEIPTPSLKKSYSWTLEQLMGFLSTWSAVQHYINDKGQNPMALIEKRLQESWGNQETKTIVFPTVLRVGKLNL